MTTTTDTTLAPNSRMAPRAVVAGADRQPRPFGLTSVLQFRQTADRWEFGVTFEFQECGPLLTYTDEGLCVDGATGPNHSQVLAAMERGIADEFTVEAAFACGPLRDNETEAVKRLQELEERQAEAVLWSKLTSAETGATTLTGGAPELALAVLENHIATEYGSLGVLHVSPGAAILLASKGLIRVSGQRMVTAIGTPVIVGAGYTGKRSGVAGDYWLYVTPALFGYRSPIDTLDLFDHSTNDPLALASRRYLIGWDDCGVATAQINPTITPAP